MDALKQLEFIATSYGKIVIFNQQEGYQVTLHCIMKSYGEEVSQQKSMYCGTSS